MSDVRFIRKGGRVIPIRGSGSEPNGVSKRYGAKRDLPAPKSIGAASGALLGASAAFGIAGMTVTRTVQSAGRKLSALEQLKSASVAIHPRAAKIAAVGALLGAAVGSLKFYKRGKGESNKQLAQRASGKKVKSSV